MNEVEKMCEGQWYNANFDQDLIRLREETDALVNAYNQHPYQDIEERESLISKIFPHKEKSVIVMAPFYTDYGRFTEIGANTFINRGAYFMDGGQIEIGKNCFIGPQCSFYTANHPLLASQRNLGFEQAKPIHVGNDVWIGGDVTILPGVTIGDKAVIGAKSLVTKDIPASCLAYGNPCKVIRLLTTEDQVDIEKGR